MLERINLLYSELVKHNSIRWFSYWCTAQHTIYYLEEEKLHMASKDQNNPQLPHQQRLMT